MKKSLYLLLAPFALSGCGASVEEEGIPPESVLAGEPDVFVPVADAPYEPGKYVATTKLVSLKGEGIDDIERRVAWGFYAGTAAAPLDFCLTPRQAQMGMMGMAEVVANDDCEISPGAKDGEVGLVCPTTDNRTTKGISRSVVQRGEGGTSPDLRMVTSESGGLGRTVELVWHISIKPTGECSPE